MKPDFSFERQLKNLEQEADAVASYVYAEMTIHHAASKSKVLLARLNLTPTFWNSCLAALQSAAYISLGRVFDLKSPYNLDALLGAMEVNLSQFHRAALASRKREGHTIDPPWLQDYLNEAYYPTQADVARLRKKVGEYRRVYDRAIMPVRHQYLAHRQAHDRDKVQRLYAQGKVAEIRRLSTFLLRLHTSLWELWHNGRKPALRQVRHSVKSIYESDTKRRGAHEYVVRDTKALLEFLETATPNHSFQRTASGGR